MYVRGEQNPLHFHALYGEYEALVDIQKLEVIEESLPRRALALVLKWANEHREELKKYGGLGPSELRRLKQLEEENRQLKKLVADFSLDKQMLQDVLTKKF